MTRPSATGRPGTPVIDRFLLDAIRQVQTGGMIDQLLIRRDTGTTSVDPDTLVETPVLKTVYEGAGRFQPLTGLNERRVIIGGETRTTNRYVAAVPWDAPEMLEGDSVTVLATSDPELIGRSVVVRDVVYDSFQTRRTLVCEDDPGQGGDADAG